MVQTWFDVLETGNISLIENCTPEIFEKLYDEFFLKLDNPNAKIHIEKTFEKNKLALRLQILINCYENLISIYNYSTKIEKVLELETKIIDTIKVLNPKVKIQGTNENKLSILEKLIKIIQFDFDRIEISNSEEKDVNFMEQIVNLELILSLKIDTLNTSVAKYIEYVKFAKMKTKAQDKTK